MKTNHRRTNKQRFYKHHQGKLYKHHQGKLARRQQNKKYRLAVKRAIAEGREIMPEYREVNKWLVLELILWY